MEIKSIGFIGGGRITKIFLKAFQNAQIFFPSVVVCDIKMDVLNELKKQFPKIQITDSCELTAGQDIVFIALHPPIILETLEQIKEYVSEKTHVVSLAPKITIEKIRSILAIKNIARMIPNTTSYINEGYNPLSFSKGYSKLEKASLLDLLTTLGKTFEIDESKLEAYAMVSAMLPTYFWFQWREIQNIGIQMGLNASESEEAILQTLLAAIDLYYNSGLSSDEVIDLIPVKPIGEDEKIITDIFQTKLMGLYKFIKP